MQHFCGKIALVLVGVLLGASAFALPEAPPRKRSVCAAHQQEKIDSEGNVQCTEMPVHFTRDPGPLCATDEWLNIDKDGSGECRKKHPLSYFPRIFPAPARTNSEGK